MVVTVKLWWIETQGGAFLLVFHNVMVSTFKFGGNRRFFGVDTADFVRCRGGTRAIRLPVVFDIPVEYVTACGYYGQQVEAMLIITGRAVSYPVDAIKLGMLLTVC